jgi:outer membrane biosynthesis protein TonB
MSAKKASDTTSGKMSTEQGFFALENASGAVVRSFNFESSKITVVYRKDNRRIETVSNLKELEELGIEFEILAETTQAELRKSPLSFPGGAVLRWVNDAEFSPSYELSEENKENYKRIIGWSAGVQIGVMGLLVAAGSFMTPQKPVDRTVTLMTPEAVQQMLAQAEKKAEEKPVVQEKQSKAAIREQQQISQSKKPVVVAPSETKITKDTPIPKRSSSFKKSAHVAKAPHPHKVHGGGYKGEGPRGYGTNEAHMNSIGALGALNNAPRVRGGNGGSGGLNLQAVSNEAGSGAGGKGFGGFGHNGGGGHGLGGLGQGKGMGLSNSMYGKGLIAAPFGDGSPAPGAGGYGTRGKAGGGARGAGYGTMTMVGSWKGTGPKGNGPAGSGVGNGDPNGSPFGSADATSDDDNVLVTGGLDRDQIAEVIARNMGQITYCYEQGLQVKPSLSGRVAVHFQIGPQGRVDFSNVAHSSVHSAQVEGCIAHKVKGWQFPKPMGGVSVAVTYPFLLRRSSQR